MGKLFSKIFRKKQDVRILMVGLDGAGKTTILYKLKLGDVVPTVPTIGFNIETVFFQDIAFTVWDVGGQDKIRPLWRHYYAATQGVIFVVDSIDRDRIEEARQEIHSMLGEEELANVCFLVFANKQDVSGALSGQELSDSLRLSKIKQRHHVIECSAKGGEGLQEGLQWLQANMKKH